MNLYNDPDIPIEEPVGHSFVIALESMPAAGYSWEADFDESMLELCRSHDFTARSAVIGSGGTEEFEFKTRRNGDTLIKMSYQRPWEKTPRKTMVFRVHIRE